MGDETHSNQDGLSVPPMATRRNYLTTLVSITGGVSLAGCSSSDDVNEPEQVDSGSDGGGGSDGNSGGESGSNGDSQAVEEPTEESTPTTAEVALGDIIEGDRLALVAYNAERTTEIGSFSQADDGNEFVVIEMAAKNKDSTEFISFSSFFQVTLRDSESYEYNQSITGTENRLSSGELAPGEVTRGNIVFEVPQDASGLSLHVDMDESLFSYGGAIIDIESEGSGRTLKQDLKTEVYDVGDTLEFGDTRFTPNEVRTSMGKDFFTPDSGNEFVVIDITVENNSDDELSVSILLQMDLKDDLGYTYSTSLSGTSSLDRGFSQGQPIAPNSKRRGEIAFEVEQGLSPLYLMMDFEIFREGDKAFFQLR